MNDTIINVFMTNVSMITTKIVISQCSDVNVLERSVNKMLSEKNVLNGKRKEKMTKHVPDIPPIPHLLE